MSLKPLIKRHNQRCNLERLLRGYEDTVNSILNDPLAQFGGVVPELLEDAEKCFLRDINEAMEREKISREAGLEILGEFAQIRYERRVYREL